MHSDGNECLLFDGMAIVNELSAQKANVHSCKELAESFVHMIELKSSRYREAYIIFDDYSVENSLKDYTRQLHTAGKAKTRSYKVDDNTCIQDYSTFLSSKGTKLQLTLYLAQKVIENCSISLATHTHKGVLSSSPSMIQIPSTQEEADTLLILYATAISQADNIPHIYCSDTDVLVLALRRFLHLNKETIMIMGTGDHRRQVKLSVIYDAVGPNRIAALPGFR